MNGFEFMAVFTVCLTVILVVRLVLEYLAWRRAA